jgi:hypothetical protein
MATVEDHFNGKSPQVFEIYRRIVDESESLGPVSEDPKKTSIHLNRRVAFAGVQTRRDALILTLKSDHGIADQRIHKTEQTSANRWHFEIRLREPGDVDVQLRDWLRASYALAE